MMGAGASKNGGEAANFCELFIKEPFEKFRLLSVFVLIATVHCHVSGPPVRQIYVYFVALNMI